MEETSRRSKNKEGRVQLIDDLMSRYGSTQSRAGGAWRAHQELSAGKRARPRELGVLMTNRGSCSLPKKLTLCLLLLPGWARPLQCPQSPCAPRGAEGSLHRWGWAGSWAGTTELPAGFLGSRGWTDRQGRKEGHVQGSLRCWERRRCPGRGGVGSAAGLRPRVGSLRPARAPGHEDVEVKSGPTGGNPLLPPGLLAQPHSLGIWGG